MPKIVDHVEYRKDLAARAASYFSAHGYAGVSMRKIAVHLGVSKSALYHYFSTKEALFLACTEQVMTCVTVDPPAEGASPEQKIQALLNMLRRDFGSEMALLFDYLRGKSSGEIAGDEAMQIALETYRRATAEIVGESKVDRTLAMIMGGLLLEYLSGGTWEFTFPSEN